MRHYTVEKGLRGSTLHAYRKIGERLAERSWRSDSAWADRVLDTFSADDLLAVRNELTQAERSADTINQYRRVVRGIFGTHPSSPALAWALKTQKVESEGKLQFYTPEQVRKLIAEAYSKMDEAIYTLATEAGPRLSEIRALKVANVDFDAGVLRFEDGFTTTGGHAGNKGRRVRSVPMTRNVRKALAPFCESKSGGMLVFEHDAKPSEPICGSGLYRRFLNASKRAGLPVLRLHDLRHTFGTQAIRGFKVHEVQRLDGPPTHHDDRTLPPQRARRWRCRQALGAVGDHDREHPAARSRRGAQRGPAAPGRLKPPAAIRSGGSRGSPVLHGRWRGRVLGESAVSVSIALERVARKRLSCTYLS